ncbi:unnamed protein product [Schistosoma margrebowiei]|uniref:Uncharacterized protein n=1 Tax=Schistosoma margrebowiei TaxID=48269 RepID=A0A183MJ52_9TREM|nr:unnamed protein product [Schistosoma margrebowiei]
MSDAASHSFNPFILGCDDVYLCLQKSIDWKEQINMTLTILMTNGRQSIRDADRIVNDFLDLVQDLPSSLKSVDSYVLY